MKRPGGPADSGILLHAKHAFMPNALGYCGPDDRGSILRHLQDSSSTPELLDVLASFEAAYPFIRFIAKSSGLAPFDYSVPEAYWIGNGLLDRTPPPDFYSFSHAQLPKRRRAEVKRVFDSLGPKAKPHHTFYVMSTYASSSVADGPSLSTDGARKVEALIENCRISPGRVTKTGPKEIEVRYRPVRLVDGTLRLGGPSLKKVAYDAGVHPFEGIQAGDWVSMHWNFACEVLSGAQARNLSRYTLSDIASANTLIRKLQPGH